METAEIFQKNIDALRTRNQEAAYILEKAAEKGDIFWFEEPAENGQATAFVEEEDGSISFFESMKDPRGVSEKRLEGIEDGTDVVVMGVGLGYTIEALAKVEDKLGFVIVIEREPAMLVRAFMHADFSNLIKRPKTCFVLAYTSQMFKLEIDTEKTLLITNQVLMKRNEEYYSIAYSSLKTTDFKVFPLAKQDNYNILLMCEDSLRKDRVSFYGGDTELFPTPNIDEFFRDAFVMDSYSVSTWTPSVIASMLSGMMPWEHGMVSEIINRRKGEFKTRPNKVFDATATHLAGMKRFKMLLSGNAWITRNFGFGGGFNLSLSKIGRIGYHGNKLNEQAKVMLDPLKNSEFFFFLHYMETHQPFLYIEDNMVDITKVRAKCVTDPRRDPIYQWDFAEELQAYNSSVVAADIHIGNMLDALISEKITEKTIIALFSDHGEELRDHGRIRYPRHGYSLYNECIDVPLLIYVPEPLRDFFKEQLARFETPRLSLINLIPMLEAISERKEFDPSWFDGIFSGFAGFQAWKSFYIENGHKLIYDMKEGTCELYDLSTDPGELKPLADAGDEIERLRRKLLEIIPPDYQMVEEEDVKVYDEKEMEDIQERLQELGYM